MVQKGVDAPEGSPELKKFQVFIKVTQTVKVFGLDVEGNHTCEAWELACLVEEGRVQHFFYFRVRSEILSYDPSICLLFKASNLKCLESIIKKLA